MSRLVLSFITIFGICYLGDVDVSTLFKVILSIALWAVHFRHMKITWQPFAALEWQESERQKWRASEADRQHQRDLQRMRDWI